ncbi:MAG: endolytic transglycosylase MltG, partial [Syntrophobacteraceae bacterium]|nr:endolytic transglycosylase MltG [Syntrophobacteraceae bacterium]
MTPFAPAVPFALSRRLYAVIAGIVLLVLVVGGLVAFYGPNDFAGEPERVFFIKRGESFAQIVDSLEAQGIIRNRTMFKLVARVYGGTDRMQIGKYRFASGISNSGLFLMMRDGGGNPLIKVSIPEGSRPHLQARLFARAIGVDSSRFVNLVYDPETTRDLGIEAESLEGYLLPETYSLHWGMDEMELIQMQVREFRSFFSDSLVQRAKDLGWSVHQAVTFASIVEGEVVLDAERPAIAG